MQAMVFRTVQYLNSPELVLSTEDKSCGTAFRRHEACRSLILAVVKSLFLPAFLYAALDASMRRYGPPACAVGKAASTPYPRLAVDSLSTASLARSLNWSMGH